MLLKITWLYLNNSIIEFFVDFLSERDVVLQCGILKPSLPSELSIYKYSMQNWLFYRCIHLFQFNLAKTQGVHIPFEVEIKLTRDFTKNLSKHIFNKQYLQNMFPLSKWNMGEILAFLAYKLSTVIFRAEMLKLFSSPLVILNHIPF